MQKSRPQLSDVLCWTRMQTESGQSIQDVIARKELERRAGDGVFFWGVGNAPSRSIRELALRGDKVDVVFSLMKSRPRIEDVAPTRLFAWRTYFDLHGKERPLPGHVLVTSRSNTVSGVKKAHYAIVCTSKNELRLGDHGTFDPSAYRNLSASQGHIGASQVTALIVRTDEESESTSYRINLRAELSGSYWVRLGRPCTVSDDNRAAIEAASRCAGATTRGWWLELVSRIQSPLTSSSGKQCYLF